MDWICPEIAIGNCREARNRELLQRERIGSMLSLDGSVREEEAESLGLAEILTVELIDGPGNNPRRLMEAVESLSSLVNSEPPVLVQCHAGRSRSAVVVAAFFMMSLRLTSQQAIVRVASRRDIQISDSLLEWLEARRTFNGS